MGQKLEAGNHSQEFNQDGINEPMPKTIEILTILSKRGRILSLPSWWKKHDKNGGLNQIVQAVSWGGKDIDTIFQLGAGPSLLLVHQWNCSTLCYQKSFLWASVQDPLNRVLWRKTGCMVLLLFYRWENRNCEKLLRIIHSCLQVSESGLRLLATLYAPLTVYLENTTWAITV